MWISKRLFVTVALACCLFCALFAQKEKEKEVKIPKMEWDKISSDDLKSTVWASDSNAVAAVLGDIGDLNMETIKNRNGFRFKERKRIKIFKKEGFEYANIRIPYYAKDDVQYVNKVRGHTIAPDGSRYEVDAKSIVREKINDRVSVVKFTFPKVTEGCVLEYEMELYSIGIWELREWYFQELIPTRLSVLDVDLYSRCEYSYLFQGEQNLKSTKPKYDNFDGRVHVTFFTEDLPALKEEKYVTSVDNHLTRIRFQLGKYYTADGSERELLTTWQNTADSFFSDDGISRKFLKKGNYSKVVEATKGVVNPSDSARLKAQKLYPASDFASEGVGRLKKRILPDG